MGECLTVDLQKGWSIFHFTFAVMHMEWKMDKGSSLFLYYIYFQCKSSEDSPDILTSYATL